MLNEVIVKQLTDDIEEGLYCKGVQAYISVGGSALVDISLGTEGTGRAVESRLLFAT